MHRFSQCLSPQLYLSVPSRAFSILPKISNFLLKSKHSSSKKTLKLINPSTGLPSAEVILSTQNDLNEAITNAQNAFEKWNSLTYKARSQFLLKFRELLLQNQENLIHTITEEHGKNLIESTGSLSKAIEVLEYAASLANNRDAIGMTMEVSSGVTCSEYRLPLGVCAAITPFNFPVMVGMWSLSLALATGNTLIVKPSEKAPRTMLKVAHLAQEAGIPPGVFQVLQGDKSLAEMMCLDERIKAVSFVGSSVVAKHITELCNRTHKRVLALGGAKNHLIALPDCNLEMTASDVVVSFTGCAGQRCMAASVLILVGEQNELLDKIVEKASKLRFGHQNNEIGPVIDKNAFDRINLFISNAEKAGKSKILIDGRKLKQNSSKLKNGFWIGPTILLHSDKNDPCIKNEIFGPVLSVYIAKNAHEALEIENSSKWGNAACVYTSVGAHAEYFSKKMNAGMIGVNIGVPVPREPFSFAGFKESRFGSHDSTGAGGVEFFTQKRKITTKWARPDNKHQNDWMS